MSLDIPERGHELILSEIVSMLNSKSDVGLSESEASARLVKYGANEIQTKKPSIWRLYFAPLFDTLIVIYLIITGIMVLFALIAALGFIEDVGFLGKTVFWLVIISFNIIMAIYQQYRAQKQLAALQQLTSPKSKVVRNGNVIEISSQDLVPGDLIELELGNKIPADCRVITSSNLTVNEASLTGESIPVAKVEDGSHRIDIDASIAQHFNMLYLGTFVQTGTAKAIIVRTGNFTEIGKIATAMSEMHTFDIPLRNRVNKLGKLLGITMIVFLLVIFSNTTINRLSTGDNYTLDTFSQDMVISIINAMAVMPINIPLMTTLVLITGVLHMAQKKVIIKELSSVETLGRISVLCSDKTGTITTSKMTSKLVWDTETFYTIYPDSNTHVSLSPIPESEIIHTLEDQDYNYEDIRDIEKGSSLELLLTTAILNNEANLVRKKEEHYNEEYFEIIGNPTDGALLLLGSSHGLQEEYLRKRYQKLKSYPFDSQVKRMSGLFKDVEDNDLMVFCKGATEVLLPRCDFIGNEENRKPLDQTEKDSIQEKVDFYANEDYRVISLAYKSIEGQTSTSVELEDRESIETNLTFIGFTIIYDPPRPGVKEAVAQLDKAGIFPIMITGDSPATAATIARQVGILDPHETVAEGKMASVLKDEDFFKVAVFARVSPADKEIIVRSYQAKGGIVAMTGDGVNDALAITKSDAGIAMGTTGTEVAKEASDIIIADDSYISIVNGVYEGRNLYERIRIMIFFYIAVNLAEAIFYFVTSLDDSYEVLNNFQRTYIFTIVHGLPIFAVIYGKFDEEIMSLKPRDNDDLIPSRMLIGLLVYSIILGLSILAVFFMYYQSPDLVNSFNQDGIARNIQFQPSSETLDFEEKFLAEDLAHAKARTMLLSVIYLSECTLILSIRRINIGIFDSIRNHTDRFMLVMAFGPIVLHLVLMYITPIQVGMLDLGLTVELIRLSFLDIGVVFIFALLPIFFLELFKWFNRRAGNQF